MKKHFLFGVALVATLVLVFLGPTLLDSYRLLRFFDKHTAAYEAGGPWPHLTDACIGCHVSEGNQNYPTLMAQPAPYLEAQLRKFAGGERVSPLMGPVAMTLTDEEIVTVTDYFSRQPPPENPGFEADADLVEAGERLVDAGGCVACHGEGMVGRDLNPRLAGQGYNYLVAQLDAFATGVRSEPTGLMQRLVSSASQEERRAMAAYLATMTH